MHDGTTFRVPVVALLRDAVDSVWPHHRVPRPTQLLTRSLIVTGLGIAAISVAMVVALHLLPGFGGVNPLRGMLSDYALHPDGWAFDWALVLMAIGSAVLWLALNRHAILRGVASNVCMALWCTALVLVAVFHKDATEVHGSMHGGLHLLATATASAALPLLGLIVGFQHRKRPQWRRYSLTSLALAISNVPCLLPFVIAFMLNVFTHSDRFSGPDTGLIERVMGGLDVLAVGVLAVWCWRAAYLEQRARSAALAACPADTEPIRTAV